MDIYVDADNLRKTMQNGEAFFVKVTSETVLNWTYVVRVENWKVKLCTCQGFAYRLSCKHAAKVKEQINRIFDPMTDVLEDDILYMIEETHEGYFCGMVAKYRAAEDAIKFIDDMQIYAKQNHQNKSWTLFKCENVGWAKT